MLKPDSIDAIKTRMADRVAAVNEVNQKVAKGRWLDAERDPARLARFLARRRRGRAPTGAEAIQGPTNDIQRSAFLVEGAEVRRAVALVEVNAAGASTLGSGFLVSPRLFITNNHVIRDVDGARVATLRFDFELDKNGRPVVGTTYLLAPDRFFFTSAEEELDFTIVALGELVNGAADVATLGYLPLSDASDKHALGIPLNIIQHPQGFTKMVTVRNNLLAERTEHTLLYETDTDVGSSGSPVFNDDWDVVALHHYGEPFRAVADRPGELAGAGARTDLNEGIRISSIVERLRASLSGLDSASAPLLQEALAIGDAATPGGGQPVLTRPGGNALSAPTRPDSSTPATGVDPVLTRPASGENLRSTAALEIPMSSDPSVANATVRIVIPLEITVSLGTPGAMQAAVVAAAPALAATRPVALKASEAKRLDTDYTSRTGYQATFIPDFEVPFPDLSKTLKADIAPLRATEADATAGVLLYEHFSVVLSRSKKIAIFTATNIDGTRYLEVDRNTGKVSGSEGETWYKDPRTSESFFLGQDFYTRWSHYFDRGHLTRRSDPTWGTNEQAERANADTFHFSNCSPQHFRFNEAAKFWQGAERFVLENGLLKADPRKRIAVLQGPIFTNDDYFSDDVQIPSSFWKVVLWQGEAGPRAVALIVDQSQLMSETRTGLGPPQELPSVNVSQWRVSVATVEKRTGLDFGASIRSADTIKEAAQPAVGEAAHPLRSFDDLKGSSRPGTFAQS